MHLPQGSAAMARRAPGSAAGRGSISRQPTLVDVAQASGVSRQTVSNAINAPQRLDPVTLARVRDAIDRLGYTPNRTARSLRARSSRFIGYRIMPFDPVRSSPVTDQFLHALAQAASREGYLILAFTPEDEPDELETYAELWRTGSVDGFVLSDVGHHDERARLLLDLDVPFVAFGRTRLPRPHSWVDVDPIAGGRVAVEHLAKQGHRRVGFIGWEDNRLSEERLTGWRRGMVAAGLPRSKSHIMRVPPGVENGAAATAQMLAVRQPPTAIVCFYDTFAAGCVAEAQRHGLKVGQDLAVIGFDDSPAASLVSPPLTTVGPP